MKAFPPDDDLTVKLQDGDVHAFDHVYEKYASRLYGFSFKYLKSTFETEELVQLVFLKVWENHSTLKKDSSLKSFLFTIAYHEICNIFRRRICLKKFISEQLYENHHASSETEEQIDFHFFQSQVDQIIARMPERLRTIFLKREGEGKSSKEIAQELGISPGTVDNYISESLKFIRSNLQNADL